MKFKKIVKETKKPMKKAQKKEQWWFDIPGAKHIYHGDWSDPEIQYKGFSLNYWDVIESMSYTYREEHPEDKDEKGFDAWMETQGGPGGYLEGELDNCIYAALGDDNVEEEPWLGIPDAYKVKEVYGQGEGEFILYKDCLVDVADVDYYDSEYDDWYPYTDNPEKFEEYYSNPKNKKELVDKLNKQVSYYMSESTKFNEGWLGDKMKAGWQKVKDGAKKVGNAIGKALNGPFKKGDVVQMSGEDGEKFKGTIMDYDRSEKTYSVMLGRQMANEGLQEDVLDMADREDELVWMIQEQIDDLRREDPELIREFALNCAELERVKPGKLKEILP